MLLSTELRLILEVQLYQSASQYNAIQYIPKMCLFLTYPQSQICDELLYCIWFYLFSIIYIFHCGCCFPVLIQTRDTLLIVDGCSQWMHINGFEILTLLLKIYFPILCVCYWYCICLQCRKCSNYVYHMSQIDSWLPMKPLILLLLLDK